MRFHSAVKCPVSTSLNKNSLTPRQEADFSATLVSNCDHGKRFDDGLADEEIKCSAIGRTGVWNHREYSCDGNCIFNYVIIPGACRPVSNTSVRIRRSG